MARTPTELALGALIVFHLGYMGARSAAWVAPDPAGRALLAVTEPWHELTGIEMFWHLFAPYPPKAGLFAEVELEWDDGRTEVLESPIAPIPGQLGYRYGRDKVVSAEAQITRVLYPYDPVAVASDPEGWATYLVGAVAERHELIVHYLHARTRSFLEQSGSPPPTRVRLVVRREPGVLEADPEPRRIAIAQLDWATGALESP